MLLLFLSEFKGVRRPDKRKVKLDLLSAKHFARASYSALNPLAYMMCKQAKVYEARDYNRWKFT